MPKDTKSLNNNKAPACESRGFVHKKEGVHFDTPSPWRRECTADDGKLFATYSAVAVISCLPK